MLHTIAMLLDWFLRATDGGSTMLYAAPVATGPAAGGGVYYAVYSRYRNQKASYQYEHNTTVELSNISGYDNQIDHRRKTTDPQTPGLELSSDPRKRVHGKPQGLGAFFIL